MGTCGCCNLSLFKEQKLEYNYLVNKKQEQKIDVNSNPKIDVNFNPKIDKINPKIYVKINSEKDVNSNPKINVKTNLKLKKMDEHPLVPSNLLFKALKSLCKITIESKSRPKKVNGFFIKIKETNQEKKYLIIVGYIISSKNVDEKIKLEIFNEKQIALNIKDHHIKYKKRKI